MCTVEVILFCELAELDITGNLTSANIFCNTSSVVDIALFIIPTAKFLFNTSVLR
jgi:hypothetical protein